MNKPNPRQTINLKTCRFYRVFFNQILTIFAAGSYLAEQKASQIRLFQPCFFKQALTGGKIGSHLGHFDQYHRVFSRSRFLLLSGTLKVEQITDFDWSRKQLVFTLEPPLRKRIKSGNATLIFGQNKCSK